MRRPVAISGFQSILERIRVKDDLDHHYETTRWINRDIAPLPPSRRTWGIGAYLGFGSITNICISQWTGAASLLSLGLTLPQTIGMMIVARVFIALFMIGNGWMGAEWHIGFTVSQRVILGMYGAYIGQVIRIMLSIVWYGSQAWLGGLCVSAMLSSWSHDFLVMKNTLPESAKMVTRDFIGFLLFHIISVPLLLIHVERAKTPVIIANFVVFIVMMSITIWACTTAGGPGPLFTPGARQPSTLSTGWAWVYGIVSSIGLISAGILNQSDFTRFARKQGVQVPGMLFSLFVPGMIVPIFAILTASASMTLYGDAPIWNPLTLITQWMMNDYSAKSRAAAFFCSLGFIIGQLSENVMANGYAAGMDLAGLFPTWITIRRGALIGAALSWAVQPWLFYNTASVFVAVAASFSVFMGPLTGVMMADYFVIRRQRIEISQLYTGSRDGAYWYSYGFNWRAIISWVVCFVPAMPGMIAAVNTSVVVSEGLYKYYLGNYLFGFIEAAVLYTVLCYVWKPKRVGLQDETDVFGTFDEDVAVRKGIVPFQRVSAVEVSGEEASVNTGKHDEGIEIRGY